MDDEQIRQMYENYKTPVTSEENSDLDEWMDVINNEEENDNGDNDDSFAEDLYAGYKIEQAYFKDEQVKAEAMIMESNIPTDMKRESTEKDEDFDAVCKKVYMEQHNIPLEHDTIVKEEADAVQDIEHAATGNNLFVDRRRSIKKVRAQMTGVKSGILRKRLAALTNDITTRETYEDADYNHMSRSLKNKLWKALKEKTRLPNFKSKALTLYYLRQVRDHKALTLPHDLVKDSYMPWKLPKTALYCLLEYVISKAKRSTDKQLCMDLKHLPDKQFLVSMLYAVYPEFPGFGLSIDAITSETDLQKVIDDLCNCLNIAATKEARWNVPLQDVTFSFNGIHLKSDEYRDIVKGLTLLLNSVVKLIEIEQLVNSLVTEFFTLFESLGLQLTDESNLKVLLDIIFKATISRLGEL